MKTYTCFYYYRSTRVIVVGPSRKRILRYDRVPGRHYFSNYYTFVDSSNLERAMKRSHLKLKKNLGILIMPKNHYYLRRFFYNGFTHLRSINLFTYVYIVEAGEAYSFKWFDIFFSKSLRNKISKPRNIKLWVWDGNVYTVRITYKSGYNRIKRLYNGLDLSYKIKIWEF